MTLIINYQLEALQTFQGNEAIERPFKLKAERAANDQPNTTTK
jgi:hypothetical protein